MYSEIESSKSSETFTATGMVGCSSPVATPGVSTSSDAENIGDYAMESLQEQSTSSSMPRFMLEESVSPPKEQSSPSLLPLEAHRPAEVESSVTSAESMTLPPSATSSSPGFNEESLIAAVPPHLVPTPEEATEDLGPGINLRPSDILSTSTLPPSAEESKTPAANYDSTESSDWAMSTTHLPRLAEVPFTSPSSSTLPFSLPQATSSADPITYTLEDIQPLPATDDTADAESVASTNDNDSSFSDENYYTDTSSNTASLLSSVKNFSYENGRRYHSYREGHYVLPNDEPEQDRQDLLHHVRNLVLGGALYRAPLESTIQRALDIGTGTGIWAIDFADNHPSAEVIGTDLSPIQPSWVPPNLRFMVDDAESPWLFSTSRPFDFIHARDLGGAIADWPRLLQQAYGSLRGGGWIELQEFEVTLKSDDESIRKAPMLCEYLGHLHYASEQFNRPMNIAEGHRQLLLEAGFEDVRDEVYKVPSSAWPHDPTQKQIGHYNLCSLLMAVESYSLALFTRVLGWSNIQTQVFLAGVRRDLRNPEVHTYCNLHIVYGRKPRHDYRNLH